MTDFDRHADEALAVANDTPGPRAGVGEPRGSGAATGRDAWRKAEAEHRKRKRNQRGRRSTDPYRRAVPGVRKPLLEEEDLDDVPGRPVDDVSTGERL